MNRAGDAGVSKTNKHHRPPSTVFHAITVVWGREYLDFFLERCIPNQLGEGMLEALPSGSRYRVMTRQLHVDELRSHPAILAVEAVIPVDIVAIAALESPETTAGEKPRDTRYERMTACHIQAIADALASNAALIFLAPDIVMSAGTLAAVVAQHRAGHRAVVCTGLRLNKEEFLSAYDASGAGATVSPRELVRAALPHLHEHARSLFLGSPTFSTFPVAVYWNVGAAGLLARCFHLHPLMIDPVSRRALPKGTVDGDYLARACPDPDSVHVVGDSDEFVLFELTSARRSIYARGKVTRENRQTLVDMGAAQSSGRGVALWRAASVAARCDEMHIGYWQRHPIHIHAEPLDEGWAAAGATADAFVRAVMWRFRPFGIRSKTWFRSIERMRQRRDRYRRAWRRTMPRVTLKQILRPVRLASNRIGKVVRKKTRSWRRYASVPR